MTDYAARFRALHTDPGFFVMPNPWDKGTARMLAGLGFSSLATSSAALAWSLGAADCSGAVTGEAAVAHAEALTRASGLPVNGDFESGYGASPAAVAETIARAIDAGIAGCSIEDVDREAGALYPLPEAARRLEAAIGVVARKNPEFVLTGRCEAFTFLPDDPLGEALARLKVYEEAGSGALYAPGATSSEAVGAIVEAAKIPVNVLAGLGGISDDLAALKALGVTRVSTGAGPAKVALGAFLKCARALDGGEVDFAGGASSADIHAALAAGSEAAGE